MPSTEEEPLSTTISERSSVEATMHALNSKRLCIDRNNIGKELHLKSYISLLKEALQLKWNQKAYTMTSSFPRRRCLKQATIMGKKLKMQLGFKEMLQWYLRMNVKWTHGYIVKAYVDWLFESISGSSSSLRSSSVSVTCSSSSFTCPSSYFSCLNEINNAKEEEGNGY